MITNLYAILASSVALLQLLLGNILVILGWSVWRHWHRATSNEQKSSLEERAYLLFLMACFLAGLNMASWPLLYMVLQSYVPAWPGVMCIYGVTRIGVGSEGPSGYLPGLLSLLQAFKPALVFLTGVWVVFYGAHRHSRTAWLLPSILVMLIIVGIVSSLDAWTEIAYLVIPKQNAFLSSGCCPVPDAFAASLADHHGRTALSLAWWLYPLYFTANLGIVVSLKVYRIVCSRQKRLWLLASLLILAVANLGISKSFVAEVLTPTLLRMPGHHCIYDLILRAPDVVLALILLAWGTLSMGWLVAAEYLAGYPETASFRDKMIDSIVRQGQYAYTLSLVLIACALLTVRG